MIHCNITCYMKGLWVIDSFLDADQCLAYRSMIDSDIEHGTQRRFTNTTHAVNNHRYRNVETTGSFLDRVIETVDEAELWPGIDISDMLYWARYEPGQGFPLHRDTGYYNTDTMCCTHTLLIYLNDDFRGGHTTFHSAEEKVSVRPVPGRAVLFDISLLHQGEKAFDGRKYWIGTELTSPPPK